MVGDGSAMLVRQAFAATGAPLTDDAVVQPVLRHYLDSYFDDDQPSVLYPGVAETLEALAACGVRLGLCTNKPERISRKLLDSLGLARLFTVVAGGDTLDVKKPDGRHLSYVIERLGNGEVLAARGDDRRQRQRREGGSCRRGAGGGDELRLSPHAGGGTGGRCDSGSLRGSSGGVGTVGAYRAGVMPKRCYPSLSRWFHALSFRAWDSRAAKALPCVCRCGSPLGVHPA